MTKENENLRTNIIEFFKSNDIHLETNILGALDQVFEEFEFIAPDGDDAVIYMKEDITDFQEDLTFVNAYNIKINGISSGIYHATYTYTGDVDYVVNEKTDLMYNDEVVENLLDFNYNNKTTIKNPNEWIIVVVETIQWMDGEYTRIPKLHIYCPFAEKVING
jgi:hypothetical protein